MTDERLIEEAAKAIIEVEYPEIAFGLLSEKRREFRREQARAALAVFEKAQTPTDDEQEALRIAEPEPSIEGWSTEDRRTAEAEAKRRFLEWEGADDEGVQRFGAGSVSGFVLGAEWWKATHPVQEPQDEPSDATTVHLTARRDGKTQALIDSMLAQANERGIRVEVAYPQSEPSDAQVEAALIAHLGYDPSPAGFPFKDGEKDQMRAALRAAEEAK